MTSDPSSNTITIKNTFNTYSSSGTFFQLPMFILNSPTNSYQYMKIQSSSYDSEYITYIVPKNISIKNLTLISNDINDEYVIKITNLNLTGTNFIETTITMSSNTEIRQSTSNLSFSEGHKMTVEIKNTSGSSTTEYILLLIDSDITINNNWIENENNNLYFTGGNVGMGVTNPGCLLDLGTNYSTNIGESSGKKLGIYNDGTSFYGFGISTNTLEFHKIIIQLLQHYHRWY